MRPLAANGLSGHALRQCAEAAFDVAPPRAIRYQAQLLGAGGAAVNGDVDVQFSGDVSARFDIETFNGDITNCFGPKAERTSKYTPGLELSFTEGDGDGRVTITTLNGDIDMCN